MYDFSLRLYKHLLKTLSDQGFSFLTFEEYTKNRSNKFVILRNDVDILPDNSLRFARLQADKNIKGTYYFRIVPQSFNEKIIKEIAELGHEIGYHYENMDTCNGNLDKAYDEFCLNLELLRKIVPIKTICMHGSPLSKFANSSIWLKYDYKKLGIIAEPYFDIDFDEVLYLTDTGRRWDGDLVSIRDKAKGIGHRAQGIDQFKDWKVKPVGISDRTPQTAHREPFPKFHSTFNLIHAAEECQLHDKIMMTFHPQRWTDEPIPWIKELVWQNVKNVGKYFLVKFRD